MKKEKRRHTQNSVEIEGERVRLHCTCIYGSSAVEIIVGWASSVLVEWDTILYDTVRQKPPPPNGRPFWSQIDHLLQYGCIADIATACPNVLPDTSSSFFFFYVFLLPASSRFFFLFPTPSYEFGLWSKRSLPRAFIRFTGKPLFNFILRARATISTHPMTVHTAHVVK